MERRDLHELLSAVRAGTVDLAVAEEQLAVAPFEDLGYAKPDIHRGVRQGVSEVVYGVGKSPEQIVGIVEALRAAGEQRILVTRLDEEKAAAVQSGLSPENAQAFVYHQLPKLALLGEPPAPDGVGYVAICAAGTSDLYCAEEVAYTAEMLGSRVHRIYDVGVSGIHRLFDKLDQIRSADVIIVVAGMEGALASVLGGLVAAPVIAVPTSVGYGANFGGLSALLSMLNSCANGVSIVNIDNGFGAGYTASVINKR